MASQVPGLASPNNVNYDFDTTGARMNPSNFNRRDLGAQHRQSLLRPAPARFHQTHPQRNQLGFSLLG